MVGPALETLLANSATGMLGTADTIAVGATGFALLGGEPRNRLPQALADRFRARRVVLASDATTAYAATNGTGPWAAIAAGTGAVALGLDPERGWRRADGRGHLLGDDGGGAWIRREGLAAALRAYDGRPDSSPQLLDALVRRFGPPEALPKLIHPSPQRVGLLVSFAQPSRPAPATVTRGRTPSWSGPGGLSPRPLTAAPDDAHVPIGRTGKLFRIGDAMLAAFETRLRELHPRVRLAASNGEPLRGALGLAASAATGTWMLPTDDALLILTHFDHVDG